MRVTDLRIGDIGAPLKYDWFYKVIELTFDITRPVLVIGPSDVRGRLKDGDGGKLPSIFERVIRDGAQIWPPDVEDVAVHFDA